MIAPSPLFCVFFSLAFSLTDILPPAHSPSASGSAISRTWSLSLTSAPRPSSSTTPPTPAAPSSAASTFRISSRVSCCGVFFVRVCARACAGDAEGDRRQTRGQKRAAVGEGERERGVGMGVGVVRGWKHACSPCVCPLVSALCCRLPAAHMFPSFPQTFPMYVCSTQTERQTRLRTSASPLPPPPFPSTAKHQLRSATSFPSSRTRSTRTWCSRPTSLCRSPP